jgi:cytochrome bd-type quinol oxidase subunit 2
LARDHLPGALIDEAGRDLPLSTEHLLVLLMAAFPVALGLTVPLMRTREGLDTVAVRWWERARWPVGVGLMLTGVVTGLVGFLVQGTLWASLMGLLILPAILLGCTFPFVGDQSWRNEFRSKA